MLSSLLNSEPAHASSPGSTRLPSSPGKQNAVPWSPHASRSPVKQNDTSLEAHNSGKSNRPSSASPSTPSRAALGNLIHATDQPPRATPTPNGDHATNHNNTDDDPASGSGNALNGNSSNTLEDGDVTMDDAPDEELVEQAMPDAAEMSEEAEGDDSEDEEDDEDDEEDSGDESDDSDSSVSRARRYCDVC